MYRRAADLGIAVVDAKKPIKITVTDEDVINAKKANSRHCALARSALRVPGVVAAYFFRSTAFLEFKDRMDRFKLPTSVQKEIVSFDRAQIFASGVYQLSPPAPGETRRDYAERHKQYRKEKRDQKRATRQVEANRRAALAQSIAKIAAREPVGDTPEQREFEAKVSKVLATQLTKHVGSRTVSGIQSAQAPLPLHRTAPTRYVHRTQYVRDLRDPDAPE